MQFRSLTGRFEFILFYISFACTHRTNQGLGSIYITKSNTEFVRVWLCGGSRFWLRVCHLVLTAEEGKGKKNTSDLPEIGLIQQRLAEGREGVCSSSDLLLVQDTLHLFPSQGIFSCLKDNCFSFETYHFCLNLQSLLL